MLLCPSSTIRFSRCLSVLDTFVQSPRHRLGPTWSRLIIALLIALLAGSLSSCAQATDPIMQHLDADHQLHLIGKEARQADTQPPPWLVQLIIPQPTSHKNSWSIRGRGLTPWRLNPRSSIQLCGGVIIGEQTILTARHCLFKHPPTHLFFTTPQDFINKYLRPTPNPEPVVIGLTHSLKKLHSIPKSFLKYQAHPQADLATITTNGCRLYDSSNFFSKVRKIRLHSNQSNAYQNLMAYGNGGVLKDIPTKFHIHYSQGAHAIAPSYFPAMYDPQLNRPKPFPTLDMACQVINESQCLEQPINCASPPQTPQQFTVTDKQCDRLLLSIGLRYFNATKYMLSHYDEPWHDIYKDFPNYRGTLAVFHPGSTHQPTPGNTYFCKGDSGSPLVNHHEELVGIFSTIITDPASIITPSPDIACSTLNLAVDVSYFQRWINSTMPWGSTPQNHLPLCSQLWDINQAL